MKTIITKRKVVTLAIIIASVFIPCEVCAQVPNNSNDSLGAEAAIKAYFNQEGKTVTASESINKCGKCGAPLLFNAPEDTWYCSKCGQRYPVKHQCNNSCIITPEQYRSGKEGCLLVEREVIHNDPGQERIILTNISKHHKKLTCLIGGIEVEIPSGRTERINAPAGSEVTIVARRELSKRGQSRPSSRSSNGQQTRTQPNSTNGQQTRTQQRSTNGQQTRTQQRHTQGQQSSTR